MKKYICMSPAAVVTGALRVKLLTVKSLFLAVTELWHYQYLWLGCQENIQSNLLMWSPLLRDHLS